LWALSVKPAPCHPSGAYNLEVAPRFLENLCTPLLHKYIYIYMRSRNRQQIHGTKSTKRTKIVRWIITLQYHTFRSARDRHQRNQPKRCRVKVISHSYLQLTCYERVQQLKRRHFFLEYLYKCAGL